jgi:hypothetical protein
MLCSRAVGSNATFEITHKSAPYITFDRSGQHAPHWSATSMPRRRWQSAVIPTSQSVSFASGPRRSTSGATL